jgi:signal transduction histidine kinase
MEVTEQVVVKRGAKDIFIILLWVFLLCIIISIFIARTISVHALKPFHQLSQYFQNKGEPQSESFANVIDIEEADVKIIAHQLEQALEKQASLIEEQVMFNQSISHEIRTPIQVMGHSMELIEANYDEIYQQPSMQRLVKSLARIKRISNALLWLTSKDTYQSESCITTVLTRVMVESESLITVHHLDITIDNINHYQPKTAVPEEVLELIFFNLINNTIHHGLQSNGSTAFTITIDESQITFSNELESSTSEQQHFNLGLKLIKKITERFGTDFKTNVINNQFNAIFFYLSE